jgi:hypothetical protein
MIPGNLLKTGIISERAKAVGIPNPVDLSMYFSLNKSLINTGLVDTVIGRHLRRRAVAAILWSSGFGCRGIVRATPPPNGGRHLATYPLNHITNPTDARRSKHTGEEPQQKPHNNDLCD